LLLLLLHFSSSLCVYRGAAAAPAPSKVRGRAGPAGGAAKKGKTLGGQFKDSLNNLMATLNATNPSFVRTVSKGENHTQLSVAVVCFFEVVFLLSFCSSKLFLLPPFSIGHHLFLLLHRRHHHHRPR